MERIAARAKQTGCFFEINSSPDRLDLSAENASAAARFILIAISTDAHSIHEFGTIRYGIEQARKAGLERTPVLNCQPLEKLTKLSRDNFSVSTLKPSAMVRKVKEYRRASTSGTLCSHADRSSPSRM